MTAPQVPQQLPGHEHVYSGKVRELYVPLDPATGERQEDRMLLVASDRISAFDHVLDSEIPDKGRILTQMSLWWFERLADLVPNHVVSTDVPQEVAGRALLVRRLSMLPVECIGRAYLTGSGLAEYQATGSVCGISLPGGLLESSRLPEPIFTPTSKAPVGEHDQPMTKDEVSRLIGAELTDRVTDLTTRVLARAEEIARPRGILIADTKVEYGLTENGELVLADEVLTPDSSRFWSAADYAEGRQQRSYDKQYVRDWLMSSASGWDRSSDEEPPALPTEVIECTRQTYIAAYEALTGTPFRW
ncbi:phosphoribosylaminoimidazolesuccinocarboxamide synthase [Austwickia chelonae]|uniref:phosphoribosylaminoimidazolesuccinocarboxamide synthase n=1 Tax=Austwickia chelonae TaxID=100225 RepID=UPI000E271F05|nr:phosphoribosylaminoimidazolesuccinocarboxamide synthase [Austwickia chelonae]